MIIPARFASTSCSDQCEWSDYIIEISQTVKEGTAPQIDKVWDQSQLHTQSSFRLAYSGLGFGATSYNTYDSYGWLNTFTLLSGLNFNPYLSAEFMLGLPKSTDQQNTNMYTVKMLAHLVHRGPLQFSIFGNLALLNSEYKEVSRNPTIPNDSIYPYSWSQRNLIAGGGAHLSVTFPQYITLRFAYLFNTGLTRMIDSQGKEALDDLMVLQSSRIYQSLGLDIIYQY